MSSITKIALIVLCAVCISTLTLASEQGLINQQAPHSQTTTPVVLHATTLELDETVFIQRRISYQRVHNAYVTREDTAEGNNDEAVRTQRTTPVAMPLSYAQGAVAKRAIVTDKNLLARKGRFSIRRIASKTTNNTAHNSTQTAQSANTTTQVGVAQVNKAVLLNIKRNSLALLSPNILVGVNSEIQAKMIATRHKVTLIKVLGGGTNRIAIYQTALDDTLVVTNNIRDNEPVRFADADIVEHFPTTH